MAVLKLGSKGEDVKALQQLLNKLGYLITIDGDFGAKTNSAVRDFQLRNKLTVDGMVGPKTMEILYKLTNTSASTGNTQSDKMIGNGVIYDPISVHITKSVNRKIKYLVIHYTAGSKSTPGSAKANRNVFLNRSASADFCVDDTTMIQVNPDPRNYYCWAVGDGKGKYGVTNSNAISIEMCSSLTKGTSAAVPNHSGWYLTDAVLNNTVKLAKLIMAKYNIPIENVIRHYDASRKSCPGIIGWNDGGLYDAKTGKPTGQKNTSEKWLEFKKRLK